MVLYVYVGSSSHCRPPTPPLPSRRPPWRCHNQPAGPTARPSAHQKTPTKNTLTVSSQLARPHGRGAPSLEFTHHPRVHACGCVSTPAPTATGTPPVAGLTPVVAAAGPSQPLTPRRRGRMDALRLHLPPTVVGGMRGREGGGEVAASSPPSPPHRGRHGQRGTPYAARP